MADEFEHNFVGRGDRGAAFAVSVDGRLVVDLWGGLADAVSERSWEEDTLQVIFSGTKGLVAVCLAVLVERGALNLEEPVAKYWPEFAVNGKDEIRVIEAASHRAGLPGIAVDVQPEELLDSQRMAELVAAERPCRESRGRIAYHALTYGWICGEIVRRVTGQTIGDFFRTEVQEPLGLATWIGLPEAQEGRVSRITVAPGFVPEPPVLNECGARTYTNPPIFRSPLMWNRSEFHMAEIPGAGGVSTARSMAELYGRLVNGGDALRGGLIAEEVRELMCHPLARGEDFCFGDPASFAVGFQLQTELCEFGEPPDAFGHCGAGGSIHGAWPGLQTGFSYCMNQLRDDETDERGQALLECLHSVLVK